MSDRKYGHKGYMNDGSREERKPAPIAPTGPRERPEGPRGRGLGAPTAIVFRCRVCGKKQQAEGSVPLDGACFSCNNDLHTCSNCSSFDSSRPNECRKPVLQRVANKSKRNICEFFTPNTVQEFMADQTAKTSDPRSAFDALFKKR